MPSPDSPQPVFMVGAGRSGTTLLRLLLDAHPEIGCPGETGVPLLVNQLARVWYTLCSDQTREHAATPSDAVVKEIRRAAQAPMIHYCRSEGKHVFCDKSLDSALHLKALNQVFPDAQYLLVFRHVMDVTASGIEASPWGFTSFGYTDFVQRSVDNFVAPLVQQWNLMVDRALEWQTRYPNKCHSVRYEDLVREPSATLANIHSFLDVTPSTSAVDAAFVKASEVDTPGDAKVAYTTGVHTASIGRGKRVPVQLIPAPLLKATNTKLVRLGYEPMMKDWNVTPPLNNASDDTSELVNMLMSILPAQVAVAPEYESLGLVALVADDIAGFTHIFDTHNGTVRRGNANEAHYTIAGSARDLIAMINDHENVGALLRSGRVRVRRDSRLDSTASLARTMKLILTVLRSRERVALRAETLL
jgi:hypothetical protein